MPGNTVARRMERPPTPTKNARGPCASGARGAHWSKNRAGGLAKGVPRSPRCRVANSTASAGAAGAGAGAAGPPPVNSGCCCPSDGGRPGAPWVSVAPWPRTSACAGTPTCCGAAGRSPWPPAPGPAVAWPGTAQGPEEATGRW
eukprot:4981182-Alexandrium_andersonii.AAC.1